MRACRTYLLLATTCMIALCIPAQGQVAYPDYVIQDVTWSSGTHHTAVTNMILSPATPTHPVTISGTADAEFVSGTHVRLAPGFHAGGFTGSEQFHAYIDPSLQPPDMVVIAPDPATHIIDNVLHVEKWEKLEIGLKLPQDYQDAIDRFFDHYYPNAPLEYTAEPNGVDKDHDLNPYADDSLQLFMTLVDPLGDTRMKWGFFMKKGTWASTDPTAQYAEDLSSPLHPYNIRFRFTPDEEGAWQFALSIKAPHTYSLASVPLAFGHYTGYGFFCDPPLPDNHGFMSVNSENKRVLKFDDGSPFFGLGTNMADMNHHLMADPPDGHWTAFYERDFDEMAQTMERLHSVGGNFMRMYLMRHIFAPEWVNAGVYDAFTTPPVCDASLSSFCYDGGWTTGYSGNCQFQCSAFDQMLDSARAHDIYIQLCIDPYPPIIAYEKHLWGAHPFVINFLEPTRQAPPLNPYDMKRFFYTEGDPTETTSGVFYYWKRKYKYIMARWGYSVNLPIIEPFNEVDQMLSYRAPDESMEPQTGVPCSDQDDLPYWDMCMENRADWQQDTDLPVVIDHWLDDLTDYVRGNVNTGDPVHSPLGEDRKLFLMSFTGPLPVSDWNYYLPLRNPKVDLADVHTALYPEQWQTSVPDPKISDAYDRAKSFHDNIPYTSAPLSARKPLNQGEFNYYTLLDYGGHTHEIEKYFLNYDVSFHNELWASAFFGKFATGTTWQWERVFWWPDALERPPQDSQNSEQLGLFSNVVGETNNLDLDIGVPVPIPNRRLYHHFKPLSDLLTHPGLAAYELFDHYYSALEAYSPGAQIECYYLKNQSASAGIGWMHNRNAWVMKSYYLASGSANENFLGCIPPTPASTNSSINLQGFQPSTLYYITWFPTRANSTVYPPDMQVTTTGTGTLQLDLTGQFGGTDNLYLDTLHADYAFVATTAPFVRGMFFPTTNDTLTEEIGWDFTLYPNPTREELFIQFPDDAPKDIILFDPSGRSIGSWGGVVGTSYRIPTDQMAKGIYYIKACNGVHTKSKKLVIH